MKIKYTIPIFVAACFIGCSDDSSSTSAGGTAESSTTVQQEKSSSSADVPDSTENSSSSVSIEISSCSKTEDASSNNKTTPIDNRKLETTYNAETGELIDGRDGEIYATTEIGGKIWMAQNLRYSSDSIDKECAVIDVEKDETIRLTYGNHYNWAAAMAIDCQALKENYQECVLQNHPHQGICPKGWHIPSYDEWKDLRNSASSLLDLISKSWATNVTSGTNKSGFNLLMNEDNGTAENPILFATTVECTPFEADSTDIPQISVYQFTYNSTGPFSNLRTVFRSSTNLFVRCLMD